MRVSSAPRSKVAQGFVHMRVFVVTYKSDKELADCVDSLLASDLKDKSFEIYVLNNYGELKLPERIAKSERTRAAQGAHSRLRPLRDYSLCVDEKYSGAQPRRRLLPRDPARAARAARRAAMW